MTQLSHDLADLRQSVCSKRSQFVSIFLMTGKGKHLAAKPHKLDPIFVVPPQHLDDISSIRQSQRLHPFLASSYISRLLLVWTILGSMFGLRRIFEWVAMLENGCYTAGSGAEDRGI
jgi:hypothetical protein